MTTSRFRRIITAGATVALSAGLAFGATGVTASAFSPLDALTNSSSTMSISVVPGDSGPSHAGDFVPVKNVRVIDGDTIEVEQGNKRTSVRLIGIDTPETVHPSRKEEPFGAEAAALVRQLISESNSKNVLLEFDPSQGERDVYGRLLAYAWTIDPATGKPDTLINLALLKAGYATEYTFNADYRHQAKFRAAEASARNAGLGIWG